MRKMLCTIGIAIVLAGCGDSTAPADVLPSALVGTWVANTTCSPDCSYTLTSVANANNHVDVVATGGLTIELLMRANGGASLNLSGLVENGTARVEGATLLLTSGGSTDTIDYTVTAASLDLRFRTPLTQLDFNGDGINDPATARAILRKK